MVAEAQRQWRPEPVLRVDAGRSRQAMPSSPSWTTRIAAIGIARSYCWESPKPVEFGDAGQNWENVGWKVSVAFTALLNKVRPKDHMEVLRALLPSRYSPLQPSGDGKQGIYLTDVR